MKMLGLIPARGGSKGIPRKNIRILAGKPLLQYTAEAALKSNLLDRIILSTDDEEIAEVGRSCGLEVPFLRPIELAQDSSPTLPVVKHALEWLLKQGGRFDAVCLLQPTCPLRTTATINSAINLFYEKQVDTLISILPVPHQFNPHWVFIKNNLGYLQLFTGEDSPIPSRQLLPEAYFREGSIYITLSKIILQQNSLYGKRMIGFEMEPDQSINIDTPEDWELAEYLLKSSYMNNQMAK